LHNQTNVLRTPVGPLGLYIFEYLCLSVIHWSHHLMSSAVSREFFIWSILLLLLFIKNFPNWIKWLRFALQYLVCAGHFELQILFCFIILLFIRFIRDLDMSNGLFSLAPGWYKESHEPSFDPWLVQRVSHFVIIFFLRIIISLHWYSNWDHTWIHLIYIVISIIRFKISKYVLLAVHFSKALSPHEAEFSVYVWHWRMHKY
jgi:hypothetical protein